MTFMPFTINHKEKYNKAMTVKLTEDQVWKIKKSAKLRNITTSYLIRQLIEQYLSYEKMI